MFRFALDFFFTNLLNSLVRQVKEEEKERGVTCFTYSSTPSTRACTEGRDGALPIVVSCKRKDTGVEKA